MTGRAAISKANKERLRDEAIKTASELTPPDHWTEEDLALWNDIISHAAVSKRSERSLIELIESTRLLRSARQIEANAETVADRLAAMRIQIAAQKSFVSLSDRFGLSPIGEGRLHLPYNSNNPKQSLADIVSGPSSASKKVKKSK
jgi:hypothetical protein